MRSRHGGNTFPICGEELGKSLTPFMYFVSDGKRFKASGAGASSMVSESLEHTTKDCTEEEYLQAVRESSASAFAGEMDHPSTFFYI